MYAGLVLCVCDASENDEGDEAVYLNVGFEDGDEQFYQFPELLKHLVSLDSYSVEDLQVLSMPALKQFLASENVKGRSNLRNQKERAQALYEVLHPEEDITEETDEMNATAQPTAQLTTQPTAQPEAEQEESDAAAEMSARLQHAAQMSQFKAKQKSEYEKLERTLRVAEQAADAARLFLSTAIPLGLGPPPSPAAPMPPIAAPDLTAVASLSPAAAPNPTPAPTATHPAPTTTVEGACGADAVERKLLHTKAVFSLVLRCQPVGKSVVKQLLRVANKMTAVRLMDHAAGRSTTTLRVYHDCHLRATSLKKLMEYAQMNVQLISEERSWPLNVDTSVADGGSENGELYFGKDGTPKTLWHIAAAVGQLVSHKVGELRETARCAAAADRKGANITARHKQLLVECIRQRALRRPPDNHPAIRAYRMHAMRGEAMYTAVKSWELTQQVVAAELARFDAKEAGMEAPSVEASAGASAGEPAGAPSGTPALFAVPPAVPPAVPTAVPPATPPAAPSAVPPAAPSAISAPSPDPRKPQHRIPARLPPFAMQSTKSVFRAPRIAEGVQGVGGAGATLHINMRVMIRCGRKGVEYAGVLTSLDEAGMWTVEYREGDKESGVNDERIRPQGLARTAPAIDMGCNTSEVKAASQFASLVRMVGEDRAVATARPDIDPHTSTLLSIFETMRPPSVEFELVRLYRRRPLFVTGCVLDVKWTFDAEGNSMFDVTHADSGFVCWSSNFSCQQGTRRSGSKRVTLTEAVMLGPVNTPLELTFEHQRSKFSFKVINPPWICGQSDQQIWKAAGKLQDRPSVSPLPPPSSSSDDEMELADDGESALDRYMLGKALSEGSTFQHLVDAILPPDSREDDSSEGESMGEQPQAEADPQPKFIFSTMAQLELATILEVAAGDKDVTVGMLSEVLLATEMARRRMELAARGMDFSRRIHVGLHVQVMASLAMLHACPCEHAPCEHAS